MKLKTLLSFIAVLLAPFICLAQEVDMADGLRQNGKIYIVVIVIAIIVSGLYAFMFYLDKKISKLEKEIKA